MSCSTSARWRWAVAVTEAARAVSLRFDAALNAGWHGAELLERNDATTTSAHIAVSPKGGAVVVWGELMGPNNIWANHFE